MDKLFYSLGNILLVLIGSALLFSCTLSIGYVLPYPATIVLITIAICIGFWFIWKDTSRKCTYGDTSIILLFSYVFLVACSTLVLSPVLGITIPSSFLMLDILPFLRHNLYLAYDFILNMYPTIAM